MGPAPPAGTAGSGSVEWRLCEVAESRRPSGAYRIVSLRDREGAEPLAGQFYVLAIAGDDKAGEASVRTRALPVAATASGPASVRLDFLVAAGDEDLDLAAGAPVRVAGPLGEPFSTPRELSPGAAGAILVGVGLGIAPLALLRRQLVARAVALRVLLGFGPGEEPGGLELFCGSGADLCPEVRLACEDGRRGHRGPVTDLLAVLLEGDDARSGVVYGCGPPPAMAAVRGLCAERGVACQLVREAPATPLRA